MAKISKRQLKSRGKTMRRKRGGNIQLLLPILIAALAVTASGFQIGGISIKTINGSRHIVMDHKNYKKLDEESKNLFRERTLFESGPWWISKDNVTCDDYNKAMDELIKKINKDAEDPDVKCET